LSFRLKTGGKIKLRNKTHSPPPQFQPILSLKIDRNCRPPCRIRRASAARWAETFADDLKHWNMFLLPIAFFAAIALAIWFVLFSAASMPIKITLGVLFVASLLLRYSRFSMAGFFLQIAIAIFVLLYRQTRSR
jgi:hypothetical protein